MQKIPEQCKLVNKDRRIICPVCGRPTQYRVRPDSQARNWPIWCKHCRQESIVNIEAPEPMIARMGVVAWALLFCPEVIARAQTTRPRRWR